MKKIKISVPSDFGKPLSRSELKNVLGGALLSGSHNKGSDDPCPGDKGFVGKGSGASCHSEYSGVKSKGTCIWMPGLFPQLLCWGGDTRTPC